MSVFISNLIVLAALCMYLFVQSACGNIELKRKVEILLASTKNEALAEKNGYIKISPHVLTLSSLNQDGNTITSKSLSVCLASLNKNNGWIPYICKETQATKTAIQDYPKLSHAAIMTNYEDLIFPLSEKVPATHLVLVQRGNDTSHNVVYWIILSGLLPNNDKSYETKFKSSADDNEHHVVAATLSLSCASHKYGPLCSVQCIPPSERHLCDETSGKLKCVEIWTGEDCDQTVFISHMEASQFIKRRRKRANSWHRFEEVHEGNIERECQEEMCSREEAREAFEDDGLTAAFWRVYTDRNHCEPNLCIAVNTLRCEDLIGDYACRCKPGYRGKNCQLQIDVCENQPCQNDGICQRHSLTSYACVCQPGYSGLTCNINVDDCVSNNCGTQGVCQDGINNYSCVCNSGFTGSTCEVNIDECESNPCQNGGTCADQIAHYTCECPDGFEGLRCENRISPCASGPCLNGGECIIDPTDYTFNCSCTEDFVGSYCQHHTNSICGSSPCMNGATCYHIDNETNSEFFCSCVFGYRGQTCNEEIPPCELHKDLCPFNSTCVSLEHDHLCVCPQGFAGDNCERLGKDEKVERLLCQDRNPCVNDAICLSIHNTTSCVCRAGFNGTFCEEEVDFCSPSPCNHDNECIQVMSGFYCNCSEGYGGKNCEFDVDECLQASLCGNGTCRNTAGSFTCECDVFSTGRFCEHSFDPCSSIPCQHHGTCLRNQTIGYTCKCLEGYGDANCQTIKDPCTNATNPCVNEANCTVHPQQSSQALCICPKDFYGPICDKASDFCAVPSNITLLNGEEVFQLRERDDCGNNGKCISNGTNGFYCECDRGFIGKYCQTVYTVPIIKCISENCKCPASLQEELKHHRGNESRLQCQYPPYGVGVCHPVTCLSPNCPTHTVELRCIWDSECLSSFMQDDHNSFLTSFNCPVIEIVFDTSKVQQNATVEFFCDKVRQLPSHQRDLDETTIHCALLSMNSVNSTVAVAVDSKKSFKRKAILEAIYIFETLEQVLDPNKDNNNDKIPAVAKDFDPIFYNIVAMRYSTFIGKPQLQKAREESEDGFDPFILVFVFVGLFVLVLVIAVGVVLYRKKRQIKELQVSYVVNPSAPSSNGSRGNEALVTPPSSRDGSPIKPRSVEDFINPMFVEDKPTCHALTSRPSVHSNAYVSIPYATASAMDLDWSKERKNVEKNTTEPNEQKSTKKHNPQQYEMMNGLATLPFDDKFQSTNEAKLQYEFAADDNESPKFELEFFSQKSEKNSYEEIEITQPRATGNNAYETIDLVFATPAISENDKDSESTQTLSHQEYSFGTEMPSVGVPVPFQSRTSSQVSEKQLKTTNKETNVAALSDDSCNESTENGKHVYNTVRSYSLKQSEIDEEKPGNMQSLPNEATNNSIEDKKHANNKVRLQSLKQSEQEEHYQTPVVFFPEKDKLFLNGTPSSGEIYMTPRKPDPTD